MLGSPVWRQELEEFTHGGPERMLRPLRSLAMTEPNTATASSQQDRTEEILDRHETSCCIVGGGPGGMMLALLLARRGVPVTLLESHPTFEREFRGDTIHPGLLEILDEIGLADRLHQ